jgi:sugar lactone lactonase YvrE
MDERRQVHQSVEVAQAAQRLARRPEGITVLRDGNIAFSNTHASRIVVFSPEGKQLRSFGTYGSGPGQFLLVTGICSDAEGFIYAADYGGEFDRISKWTPQGKLVATWSGHGSGPRQFRRPCGLAISREGDLLVADIGNHRIQRLNRKTGAYKGEFGGRGRGNGQLTYPYGVAVDGSGNIYAVEYGNHRVQSFHRTASTSRSGAAPARPSDNWRHRAASPLIKMVPCMSWTR